MNHKILSIFAACFLIISCKNEGKKEEGTEIVSEQKRMHVQMNVIQKTADNYAVYFTEDNTINFSDENTIWNEVKASPTEQTLDFYFPEAASPTHIRFDIGNKPEREDVVLNKFKLSYGDKSMEVKGADFFNYFQKNDSILTEIDQVNGSIKFLKKAGSKATPFFYPNEGFVAEIAKIMK